MHSPGVGMECSQPGLLARLQAGEMIGEVERFPSNDCLACLRSTGRAYFPSAMSAEDFLLRMSPGTRQTWELILRPYLRNPAAMAGPPVIRNSVLSLDEMEGKFCGVANARAELDSNRVAVFSGLSRDGPVPNARPGVVVEQPAGATHSDWNVYQLPLPAPGMYWHD